MSISEIVGLISAFATVVSMIFALVDHYSWHRKIINLSDIRDRLPQDCENRLIINQLINDQTTKHLAFDQTLADWKESRSLSDVALIYFKLFLFFALIGVASFFVYIAVSTFVEAISAFIKAISTNADIAMPTIILYVVVGVAIAAAFSCLIMAAVMGLFNLIQKRIDAKISNRNAL